MEKEKELNLGLPPVDYDMLARKVKEKALAMRHWPIDTLAEQLMRTAYSVLMIQSYDSRSPMAMDIRTACFQFMADLDAEAPQGYAEHTFADKLHAIHEKHYRLNRYHGRYTG